MKPFSVLIWTILMMGAAFDLGRTVGRGECSVDAGVCPLHRPDAGQRFGDDER